MGVISDKLNKWIFHKMTGGGPLSPLFHRLFGPILDDPGYSDSSQLKDEIIALKAFNGKYISLIFDKGNVIKANSLTITELENFRIYRLGENKIALRNITNDLYVQANMNNNGMLCVRSSKIEEWEVFYLKDLYNGKYAFEAANKKYVSARIDKDSELIANADKIQSWEEFEIVKL